MTQDSDSGPAYRQPWFWLVMSPLIVVICVVLTFVGVSLFHADDRVVDNYYKQGRTINQSFAQEERARELDVQANVRFDQITGEVIVNLSKEGAMPEQLYLMVGHPIDAEQDQHIELQPVRAGYYRGDLSTALSHRRYLTLLPEYEGESLRSAEWLLRGEIQFELDSQTQLAPTERGRSGSDAQP
ncbi:FixH family protein [Marinimicrobium locisalis]|uniref:FixH family protein n=1 Tax=Marinimicrobium locisalis TaxID=546022 RepID=UPI003221473F